MNFWVLTLILGALGSTAWILSIPKTPSLNANSALSEEIKREIASIPNDSDKSSNTLAYSFTKVMNKLEEQQSHQLLMNQINLIYDNNHTPSPSNESLLKIRSLFGKEESSQLAFALIYLNALKSMQSSNEVSLSKKIFEELQKNPAESARSFENILDQISNQVETTALSTEESELLTKAFLRLDYYSQNIENTLKTDNHNRMNRLVNIAALDSLPQAQALNVYSYLLSTAPDSRSILESSISLIQKNPTLKPSVERQLQQISPGIVAEFQAETQRLGI